MDMESLTVHIDSMVNRNILRNGGKNNLESFFIVKDDTQDGSNGNNLSNPQDVSYENSLIIDIDENGN